MRQLQQPETLPKYDYLIYLDPWQSHLSASGTSPLTIKNYRYHVLSLLSEYPSPILPDIDCILAAARGHGTSVAGINNKVAAYTSFFRYCAAVHHAPDPSINLHRSKGVYRGRRPPPAENVQKLLNLPLSIRDRALLALFLDGGLRLTEAITLKPANIAPNAKSVTFIGKGDKPNTIPLSPRAAAALRAHIEDLHPASRWLFPSAGDGHISAARTEARLATLCKQAGIPKIAPHQLRHYFATHMLNSGANLKTVSELLGHASPAVTATVYWHIDEAQNQAEHAKHSPYTDLEVRRNAPTLF